METAARCLDNKNGDSGPMQTSELNDANEKLDIAIDLLEDVQGKLSGGRPKAIRLRFGDRTIAEFPVALTAFAAVAAGFAAVLLSRTTIEIVHED